jgi:PAS domain S-box-containing protein
MNILQLIDLTKLKSLLDKYCQSVGIALTIIDLEGKVLIRLNWLRICKDFHCKQHKSLKRCIESHSVLFSRLKSGKEFVISTCCKGLTNCASPIIIQGEHVANLFIAQFLLKEADQDMFRKQAAQYKYKNKQYMDALSHVPVISEGKAKSIMKYVLSFVEFLVEMGKDAPKVLDINEKLIVNKDKCKHKGVYISDLEGNFIDANTEWINILGYTKEEIRSLNFSNLLTEDQVPFAVNTLKELKKNVSKKEIVEFRLKRRDGRFIWIGTKAFVIYKDEKPWAIKWIVWDITERKHLEEELSRASRQWYSTFDAMADAIALVDLEQNILRCNFSMSKFAGKHPKEIIGHTCCNLIHGKSELPKNCPVKKMKQTGKRERMELKIDKRWFLITAEPIRDSNGNLNGAVHILSDITERKGVEEELEKYRNQLEERIRDRTEALERSRKAAISLMDDADIQRKKAEEALAEVKKYRDQLEKLVKERTFKLEKEIGERMRMEEWLHRVIEESPFPIMIFAEDGEVIRLSRSWTEITGYTKDEIPTIAKWTKMAYGKQEQMFHSDIKDLFSIKHRVHEGEYTIKSKTDDKIIWDISLAPLGKMLDGRRTVLSIASDVTQRKKAEEELKKYREDLEELVKERTEALEKSRKAALSIMQDADAQRKRAEAAFLKLGEYLQEVQKLSQAVEQSPVMVVITDPNGNIEYVNPAFTKVTGFTSGEAIGQNFRIFRLGVFPVDNQKNIWDTILSGKVWKGEYKNKKKNGEIFWESASISPILNENSKIIHFVAIKEDITKRKNLEDDYRKAKEEADKANQAKSEFLANMSHEIRTPMNAIMGMIRLARRTELSDKQRDYLDKIMASSHILQGIIDDILDFSKIEAGKLEMESIDFDLSEVMGNVVNITRIYAEEKDLDLEIDMANNVPILLKGDPLRLSQVLLNLTNNAVKFTESGEIGIKVELSKKTKKSTTLIFSVKDTGIGITDEQVSRLFKPFSQLDSSTTRSYGGSGLGLSISKVLVKRMGGEIQVESKPLQGSTFSFTSEFALQVIKRRKFRKTRLKVPTELETIRGAHVLLVEDNDINRQVAREILENEGILVTTACTGQEAIQYIKQAYLKGNFDAVLMDLQMPVMDGYETTREIRKLSGFEVLPIIAMTAHAIKGVEKKCLKAGMNDYVTKPIDPEKLYYVLARWIKLAQVKTISRKKTIAETDMPEKSRFKEIAGINLEAGLKHVAGNKEFYIKILQRFSINYSSFIDDFNQLVDLGKRKEAIRLVHSLKGVVGIIGAEKLHFNVDELEDSLEKGNEKKGEIYLEKVNSDLKQLLKEIDKAGILKVQVKNTGTPEQKVVLKELRSQLNILKDLLESYQADAVNFYANISHFLIASGFLSESKVLKQSIELYDFEKALQIVEEIESKLKN